MPKAERNAKKRNFTQCEVEVLVREVEKRKADYLVDTVLGWVTNAKKALEWQHVADNVNAVALVWPKWYQCKHNLSYYCLTIVLNHMFPVCTPESMFVQSL